MREKYGFFLSCGFLLFFERQYNLIVSHFYLNLMSFRECEVLPPGQFSPPSSRDPEVGYFNQNIWGGGLRSYSSNVYACVCESACSFVCFVCEPVCVPVGVLCAGACTRVRARGRACVFPCLSVGLFGWGCVGCVGGHTCVWLGVSVLCIFQKVCVVEGGGRRVSKEMSRLLLCLSPKDTDVPWPLVLRQPLFLFLHLFGTPGEPPGSLQLEQN